MSSPTMLNVTQNQTKNTFFHRITTQANTPLKQYETKANAGSTCHFSYCYVLPFLWNWICDLISKSTNYLPMTVKLIFKFRVGELRKSTRHRYIPSSDNFILSTFNCAGRFTVLKKARDPNTVGDDHSFACPIGRPRTSKL